MRLATLIVSTLVAANPAPAKRLTPAEREARAFLESFDGLAQPVARVASEAAWRAATDVTAANTGARAGAEKAAAALTGARPLIEKARALLAREKQLQHLTVRQLRKLLLTAAENPGTLPDVVARRLEGEALQSSVLDGFVFCLQPGARPGRPLPAPRDRQPDRRAAADVGEPRRARAGVGGQQGNGPPAEAGPGRLVGAAQPGGQGAGLRLVLRPPGRRLRHDRPRDDGPAATAPWRPPGPLYDGLHCWARHTLAAPLRAAGARG